MTAALWSAAVWTGWALATVASNSTTTSARSERCMVCLPPRSPFSSRQGRECDATAPRRQGEEPESRRPGSRHECENSLPGRPALHYNSILGQSLPLSRRDNQPLVQALPKNKGELLKGGRMT